MRYAMIDSTNTVVNVILWDGHQPILNPAGTSLIEVPDGNNVSIGWSYDPTSGVFTNNSPDPDPPTPVFIPRVVSVGFVRFTIAAGLVTTTVDTVGVGAITRISPGRYRIAYLSPDPTQTLVAQPDFLDTVPRIIRVQSPRSSAYAEIRVTDLTGAAVDPPEVTVLINRVISQ